MEKVDGKNVDGKVEKLNEWQLRIVVRQSLRLYPAQKGQWSCTSEVSNDRTTVRDSVDETRE